MTYALSEGSCVRDLDVSNLALHALPQVCRLLSFSLNLHAMPRCLPTCTYHMGQCHALVQVSCNSHDDDGDGNDGTVNMAMTAAVMATMTVAVMPKLYGKKTRVL